jgi:hypothetical protein
LTQIKQNFNPKNLFFYLLSFTVPLPLFINVKSLEFILIPFNKNVIPLGVGAPIPIGLISIAIILLLKIRFSDLPSYLSILFVSILININLFFRLDFFRVISLLLIPLIIWSVYRFSKYEHSYFTSGYIAGVFAYCLIHLTSFIYMSGGFDLFNDSLMARSIFGIEIYQYYVSYPAVFSFLCVTLIFIHFFNPNQNVIFRTVLILLCFFEVFITLRKAALLDLFICLSFIAIYYLFSRKKSVFNYKNILIMISISWLFYTTYSFGDQFRGFSLDVSAGQRMGPYLIFWNIFKNIDISSLFFGIEQGWGGYSNLFVEVFLRAGLFGLLPFIILVIYYLSKFLKSCTTDITRYEPSVKLLSTLYFTFVILSILISNLVNMNFVLPYYTINILATLLYFKSRISIYA